MEIKYIDTCSTKGYDWTTGKRPYIVVHQNKIPLIIYKQHILAVGHGDDKNNAKIYIGDGYFNTDEKYRDVVKMLI